MVKQEVVFLLVLIAGSLSAPVDDPQVLVLPPSAQVSEEITIQPAQFSDPVTPTKVQDTEKLILPWKSLSKEKADTLLEILKEMSELVQELQSLRTPSTSNQIKVDGVANTAKTTVIKAEDSL